MNWRQNPQRIAWLILVVTFLMCVVTGVAVPLGVRGFLLHATLPRTAYVTATAGTVQFQAPGAAERLAVTGRRAVPEGSRIMTDGSARAQLTLFADEAAEQVLATVQLFQDTTIELQQARVPRFRWSGDPNRLALALQSGRLVIATQAVGGRAVQGHLTSSQAVITFDGGTYDITAAATETVVRVRSGAAEVTAAGTRVGAQSGERVSVPTGRSPALPVPDALNLVLNGSFEGRLPPTWREVINIREGFPAGKVIQESMGQRQTVRFVRRTEPEDGVPNEAGLLQAVNRDVQGYDSLVLRLDLQVLQQSVPGCGERASECPVMVKLNYTDIYGKDQFWVRGFYYEGLPTQSKWDPPDTRGERVFQGSWYIYESPNLFQLLKDTRPARINSIAIYAQGHDYDSRIADVALTVR